MTLSNLYRSLNLMLDGICRLIGFVLSFLMWHLLPAGLWSLGYLLGRKLVGLYGPGFLVLAVASCILALVCLRHPRPSFDLLTGETSTQHKLRIVGYALLLPRFLLYLSATVCLGGLTAALDYPDSFRVGLAVTIGVVMLYRILSPIADQLEITLLRGSIEVGRLTIWMSLLGGNSDELTKYMDSQARGTMIPGWLHVTALSDGQFALTLKNDICLARLILNPAIAEHGRQRALEIFYRWSGMKIEYEALYPNGTVRRMTSKPSGIRPRMDIPC